MDFYSRLLANNLVGGGSAAKENFKLAVSGNLTTVNAKMLDGVTRIGAHAFYNCSLTSVTIPNSVTSIGICAFENCTSLTSITLPDSLTSIGDYAFRICTSLTSVEVPGSVTSIGNYAFDSTSLTSVEIPNSVTSIGDYAFGYCGLTSATVLATTPPTLGGNAFYGTHSSLKIYVPSASVNAYKTSTNWNSYSSKIYAIPS